MATHDAQMNQYLNIISTAVKGKDMRSALHDSIEKAYNDAYDWNDQAIRTANAAEDKADQAVETVEQATSTIAEIEDLAEELQDQYDETAARIDNIIAHNNDTEGNSELIDIRTTFQGSVSESAGGAVRFQARQLNNRMDQIVRTFPTTTVAAELTGQMDDSDNIWINSSAGSALGATTISLDESVYTPENIFLRFEYVPNTNTQNESHFYMAPLPNDYVDFGPNFLLVLPVEGSAGIDYVTRKISINSAGDEITIGNATRVKTDNPFTLSGSDLAIVTPSCTAVSGSTDSNVNYFLNIARIDLIKITFNGSLSVAKDSEIVDARIGADGVTYNTLGEAIRTQVAQYVDAALIEAINDSY